MTWGARVHETGKWGLVEWDKPTPEQALAIRRNIARKAWAKYQKSRDAQTSLWRDTVLGDAQFFDALLRPAIQRLDEYGDALKDPGNLTADVVGELYKNAIADWMEFDYLTSELRRNYLENKVMAR